MTDINITSNEAEACHHLGENLNSIVKNPINISNVNLFSSENLTPVNSKLVFNCRKLKRGSDIKNASPSKEWST